jgi:hypothetical protein
VADDARQTAVAKPKLADGGVGGAPAKAPIDLHQRILDGGAVSGLVHDPPMLAFVIRVSPMQERIETFDDFWPHYCAAHAHRANRMAHYIGTTAVLGTVAAAALTLNPAWLLLAPVVGYGSAFIGHFVFEGNKPATFEHPLWSLRGDFRMYGLALRGKMGHEVGGGPRNGSATAAA